MTTSSIPRVVAVTGASGYIGERLVEYLLAEPAIKRVVGIDIRASPLENEKLHAVSNSADAQVNSAAR